MQYEKNNVKVDDLLKYEKFYFIEKLERHYKKHFCNQFFFYPLKFMIMTNRVKEEAAMENNLILKRFFSKTMLHGLLSDKQNELFDCVVRRYINNPVGKKYEELISEIYTYVDKKYRTEYFYKNTILNKLLFKRHNYKKTIALTELPIANSKADFVMINGKGVVYEIKTELDNLDRLNSQVNDYYQAFTEVVIVTYEENLTKVLGLVPEEVGLIQLTKRKALRTIREPRHNNQHLDYYTIFKILRKQEFENIIVDHGFHLPDVVQFDYYKECLKIIQCININLLQEAMLMQLKKRMRIELVEFCRDTPSELHFLTYFDDITANNRERFITKLNEDYGG